MKSSEEMASEVLKKRDEYVIRQRIARDNRRRTVKTVIICAVVLLSAGAGVFTVINVIPKAPSPASSSGTSYTPPVTTAENTETTTLTSILPTSSVPSGTTAKIIEITTVNTPVTSIPAVTTTETHAVTTTKPDTATDPTAQNEKTTKDPRYVPSAEPPDFIEKIRDFFGGLLGDIDIGSIIIGGNTSGSNTDMLTPADIAAVTEKGSDIISSTVSGSFTVSRSYYKRLSVTGGAYSVVHSTAFFPVYCDDVIIGILSAHKQKGVLDISYNHDAKTVSVMNAFFGMHKGEKLVFAQYASCEFITAPDGSVCVPSGGEVNIEALNGKVFYDKFSSFDNITYTP